MATWRWTGDIEIGGNIILNSIGNQIITVGDGSPEGVVNAAKGSLYLRTDGEAGACLYTKETNSGTTGWSVGVGSVIYVGGDTGPTLSSGTGSPEGVVTAPPGSLYMNSSGGANTSLYVKESGIGNTGWVAK
jgi:hypothetical protein